MEKTKPEISIIIPVHNGQEHLEKCLLSIKNQSFTDYEVLVVNNGSTDNTQKIAESFSESDKRFITIKHNHGGAGETRNIGIDRASGNYLAFVDLIFSSVSFLLGICFFFPKPSRLKFGFLLAFYTLFVISTILFAVFMVWAVPASDYEAHILK